MAIYVIRRNTNDEVAIINPDTGEQISQWWKMIYLNAKPTEYYGVKNHDNKYAIFHINNPNEPISQWYMKLA